MHNNVCLDFDGGSSSKARLGTRITKVGQTNIDEFLLDFFWRRVNFFAFTASGPVAASLSEAGIPMADPAPKPGQRRLQKNRTMPGTILASVHFGYCRQFMRAILGKADTKDASRAIKRARGVLLWRPAASTPMRKAT
ncbi:hypothetical protein [Mesorhizobium tianshanense]|uniref:hypothetical protein n=1 Tax=Mesorhizobium tianshanense TaxID=39844 RepID=UPI0011A69B16|nr:hypothetical protein [Mesorhizobium tianshanense]